MSRAARSVERLLGALYVLVWLASCEGYAAANRDDDDEDVFERWRAAGSA